MGYSFNGYTVEPEGTVKDVIFHRIKQTDRILDAAKDLGFQSSAKGNKLARDLCKAFGTEISRTPGYKVVYKLKSDLYSYEFTLPLSTEWGAVSLNVTRTITNRRHFIEQICKDLRVNVSEGDSDVDMAKKIQGTALHNFKKVSFESTTDAMRAIAAEAGVEIPPKASASKLYTLLKPVMRLTDYREGDGTSYLGSNWTEHTLIKHDDSGLGETIIILKKDWGNSFTVEFYRAR